MATSVSGNEFFRNVKVTQQDFTTVGADTTQTSTLVDGSWTFGVGAALTAAATIVPTHTHHTITGAATITNIDTTFAKAGNTLTLISTNTDATVVSATAGNIVNPLGAQTLDAVGDNATLAYSGTSWYFVSAAVA